MLHPRRRDLRTANDAGPVATVAKVAWIDRYRLRLTQDLPMLPPVDAALLAVAAYAEDHACDRCPDDSAARYAATRAVSAIPLARRRG